LLYYAIDGLPIIFMTLASLNIQIQIFIHDSDIIEYSNTIFPFGFGEYMKNKYDIPDYGVSEY